MLVHQRVPMVQRFTAQRPGKSPGAPAPGQALKRRKRRARHGRKSWRGDWAEKILGQPGQAAINLPWLGRFGCYFGVYHIGIKPSMPFFLDTFLNRRGHPWSAVFHCILQPLTLHMCHGSITALQPLTFLLVFSAMAKQKQNQKKHQKNKKPKKQKNKRQKKQQQHDKTQLSATTPPLGCAIFFFVSCFLVRCWFFCNG